MNPVLVIAGLLAALGVVAMAAPRRPSLSSSTSERDVTAAEILAAYPKAGELAPLVVSLSKRLGVRPQWLARLIDFESARTWSPSVKHPHSGATGLIQFMPKTALNLGTTTDDLARMTPTQQWLFVERYLLPYAPLRTEPDLHMAVFYPAAIGKGPSWRFPANVTAANPGIYTPADYTRLATRGAKL